MIRSLPSVEPSEAQFTTLVLELLERYGWKRTHFKPGMFRDGRWATRGEGDSAGWPDVFATRGHRALALELKVGKNRTTQAQDDWLDALGHAGIEVHVVKPSQWEWLVGLVK